MKSEDATEKLGQLVEALLADPEVAGENWHGLVVVGVVEAKSRSLSGYAFDRAGQEESVAPRGGNAMRYLQALNDDMFEDTGRRWKSCLLIMRHGATFSAEFEYDDAGRWAISPVTLETQIDAFRALVM
jgi:hypothetical protein